MSEKREVVTRGFVIGRISVGEGSTRVSVYTEEVGLVFARARSSREERSKLRPHLQIGSYGMFTFVKGAQDWHVIGAEDTHNIHFELQEKPKANIAASRLLGVLRQLVRGEGVHSTLFDAVWNFFDALTTLDESDAVLVEHITLVRILGALGYIGRNTALPNLEGGVIDDVLCSTCRPHQKQFVHAINEALLASGLT